MFENNLKKVTVVKVLCALGTSFLCSPYFACSNVSGVRNSELLLVTVYQTSAIVCFGHVVYRTPGYRNNARAVMFTSPAWHVRTNQSPPIVRAVIGTSRLRLNTYISKPFCINN